MAKAGELLETIYLSVIHVTCFSYLLYNCAERVKSYYLNVDNLISNIKATTVKKEARRYLFIEIGYPPEPLVTKWRSWLKAEM